MEKSPVKRRETAAVGFVAALTPAARILPVLSAASAGPAAWLCPLAALPGALIVAECLLSAMRRARPGEGLSAVTLRLLGRGAGGVLLALYALWLVFYAAFSLRSASARFTIAIYPGTNPGIFMAVGAAACLIPAMGRYVSLGRAAVIFRGLLALVLILIIALGISNADPGNLLPVTPEDALPVLAGAPGAVGILTLLLVCTSLPGGAAISRRRDYARRCLVLSVLFSLIVAVTVGRFGAELTGRFELPFFTMVKNLSVPGLTDRVEALITAFWVFSDFVMCSLTLMAASRAARLVLSMPEEPPGPGLRSGRWITPLFTAAAFAVASVMAPTNFVLTALSERFVPALNLIMAGLLILPAALAAHIKGQGPPSRRQ